ncbi:EF2563 family selenium-dependent molybdenum hydroxylase system protein [Clostridium botulinum]|uniref:Selenium-dependent molybdenum hydroxylase system protein, YqeB family n=1 Tax=Clostridium botulinum (strain Eklund 17B / Type B) TaxID=935198 RepID=B2TKP4_CLOBB|nr:selenium-dependent molybdenum cofactor biosynthesis protein YqeB [Clostridium sp. VAP41]ACD21975.1 selenium-dependent molybdenum hydroxylase system protein, YqeB family [Clostridium botulinum B str. Eklund 17B (NRP)]MBY6976519.1 EF2563 family selenium-dependent molybdenum hydroxylase system protein [Clostridium botulinum]MBY7001548.1 EF2563 family selenium-dependent molybdenum hydroxylase system protein [Clostridium botulinum]MCR1274385.1 selenium-dependent molybdenum cofactor biosynthesis p
MIVIKGAGDLATGVATRLKKCGFDIVMTEISQPTTVRRTVAFSQVVYDKKVEVEGITAVLASNKEDINKIVEEGRVAVLVDEKAKIIDEIKPEIIIDAIIAKKNLGTKIDDANIVIALGPGFTAGIDCHCVIETKRGHYLGKAIYKGSAIPNTGVPGEVGGFSKERIIRATTDGKIAPVSKIGDYVKKGDIVAYVNETPIFAKLDGIVRGMLQKDVNVFKGMKSGDIDPRCEKNHCFTISDKARSIGGGVLEAILHLSNFKF